MRALVIGATGGIGRRIAPTLSQPGTELFVHGRADDERMSSLLEEIAAAGATGQKVIRTIHRAEDIESEVKRLLPLDVLVLSFGPIMQAPICEMQTEDWRTMAELNFVVPSAVISRCIPTMKERNFGRILVFGGTGTDRIRGFSTIAAYSAAKTALGSVVKSAARQVAGYDICVNALCPGYVDTEYYNESDRKQARRHAPGGRMVEPTEVAETAGFLLSRGNRSLTGAVIPMDGGMA